MFREVDINACTLTNNRRSNFDLGARCSRQWRQTVCYKPSSGAVCQDYFRAKFQQSRFKSDAFSRLSSFDFVRLFPDVIERKASAKGKSLHESLR